MTIHTVSKGKRGLGRQTQRGKVTYILHQGVELTVAAVDDPSANIVSDFYLVDLQRGTSTDSQASERLMNQKREIQRHRQSKFVSSCLG
jgi:hypothetical protein